MLDKFFSNLLKTLSHNYQTQCWKHQNILPQVKQVGIVSVLTEQEVAIEIKICPLYIAKSNNKSWMHSSSSSSINTIDLNPSELIVIISLLSIALQALKLFSAEFALSNYISG